MRTLQNNFTAPEQSKRLLELGLPADSADMIIESGCSVKRTIPDWTVFTEWCKNSDGIINYEDVIPCWSVGRLLEIINICNCTDFPIECETWRKVRIIDYMLEHIEHLLKIKCIDFSKLDK